MSNRVIPFVDLNLYHKLPEKKFKIGIIGTGFVANTYEMRGYKLAGFDVVAICDINKERLNPFQKNGI